MIRPPPVHVHTHRAGAGDRFGQFVALDGGRTLVSGSLDDDNGLNAGAAYVFRKTTGGRAAVSSQRSAVSQRHSGAEARPQACKLTAEG